MNATTMDVEGAAEDIVAAIENATEARRTDECCRADAMLEIYGMGTSSGTDSAAATGGVGPGTPTTSTDVGSAGTLADGTACQCENVNATELLPTSAGPLLHAFVYNSCEGYNEIVPYTDPLTDGELTYLVSRDAFCIPETVLVGGDCECEMVDYTYDIYDSTGTMGTITAPYDTCVGNTSDIGYVTYGAFDAPGYCNLDQSDINVYFGPDITSGIFAGDLCPPMRAGQPVIADPFGNQFYRAIAFITPSISISCPAPADDSVTDDCDPPCDVFGQPLMNGNGASICCSPKDGQTILVPHKNKCGDVLYYAEDAIFFPEAYVYDAEQDLYSVDVCGVVAGSELPMNGPGNAGLSPVSNGMFAGYVYACSPDVVEEGLSGLLGIFTKAEVDCGDPQTLTESYTQQWCQYLKCQAAYQNWMTGVLGVQIVSSIYYAVEAQKCLNDILDDQKAISTIALSDMQNLKACADEISNQQNGLIKQCQNSLMENYVNRLGIINDGTKAICEEGDDLWDCFERTHKPWAEKTVPILYDALSNAIVNGGVTSDKISDWSQVMDSVFTDCFLPEMKREFLCILDSANQPTANINQWRDDKHAQAVALNDHYKTKYQCGEGTLIPAVMRMSQCMVEKICELRDYLKDCGEQDICDWNEHYRKGEMEHAAQSYNVAKAGFPRVASSLQWLDTNIHAFQELAKCYETGEMRLSAEIYDQSNALAPEICDAYQAFKDQRVEYGDFWENCWKDRQCRLVRKELDLACKLADCMDESIERLVSYAIDGDKRYKNWYETAEQHTAPKVIWAGNEAVDELTEVSDLFQEQTEKFRDIWECKILPCDMLDLEKHCDLWCHTNPLLEISETNRDLKDLQIRAQDAYEQSVLEAVSILDDINDKGEEFDYCIEEQALLHVRAQFDKAEEEILRCNSRYCGGFMAEALVRLKTERAKAEGGAFESANRWKWWANEQIKRRRFEQQSNLLSIMSGYGSQSISAAQAAIAGNEFLVTSNDRALKRTYTYLSQMDSAGARAESVNSQLMANMQQMIQSGHFWPSFSVSTEMQANQAKQNMMSNAQSVMEQGNFFLERETWSTLNGSKFLNDMLDLGNQTTGLGRYWTDKAVQSNAERAQEGRAAVQLGQQTVTSGHQLHRMGTDKISAALSASMTAANPGLSAVEIGQRYSAKSLDSQSECIDNALQHMTLANAVINSGLSFMGEVRDAYGSSATQAINAQSQLINMLQESRQLASQSLAFQEECYSQSQEMLWKSKAFIQDNWRITQAALHGSDLNSLNGLSNQLQNNFDSNIGDIFAGLTALGGNLTQSSAPIGIPNVGGF